MTTDNLAWHDVPELNALSHTLTAGQAIQAWREGEGWSLSELGKRLGLSRQLVHAYECGQRAVTVEKAIQFAACFGFSSLTLIRYALRDQLRKAGVEEPAITKLVG